MIDDADARALEAAQRALADVARRLADAGARDEAVAEVVTPKPVLGIARAPRMRPLARAWRLGPILVAADGRVWSTGRSTRVAEVGRPQHLSSSAEQRRAERAAAQKGGFAMGETVNHGVSPIAIDASLVGASGPIRIRDGATWLHWGSDAPAPLERALADLADLLLHPPAGA